MSHLLFAVVWGSTLVRARRLTRRQRLNAKAYKLYLSQWHRQDGPWGQRKNRMPTCFQSCVFDHILPCLRGSARGNRKLRRTSTRNTRSYGKRLVATTQTHIHTYRCERLQCQPRIGSHYDTPKASVAHKPTEVVIDVRMYVYAYVLYANLVYWKLGGGLVSQ